MKLESYLWAHSKNCLSDFIEFDYFYVYVDPRRIWLKYYWHPKFHQKMDRWMFSSSLCCLRYELELVFDELFCSNVDNNCVLTFDWFLSESTIWHDANKGTNSCVGESINSRLINFIALTTLSSLRSLLDRIRLKTNFTDRCYFLTMVSCMLITNQRFNNNF